MELYGKYIRLRDLKKKLFNMALISVTMWILVEIASYLMKKSGNHTLLPFSTGAVIIQGIIAFRAMKMLKEASRLRKEIRDGV
jgi:hypothetical protein